MGLNSIDKLYRGFANNLIQMELMAGNINVIAPLGFYLLLNKRGLLVDYDPYIVSHGNFDSKLFGLDESEQAAEVNPFGSIYDIRIDLGSGISIGVNDVCTLMPPTNHFFSFVRIIREINNLDHARLFENIISLYADQIGRNQGELFQPKEVTHLVISLIQQTDCKSAYNPFAGIASYQLDSRSIEYYSQEINRNTWLIGKLRLLLNDIESNYMLEDSIESWNAKHSDQAHSKPTYDLIIGTPPFNGRLRSGMGSECEPYNNNSTCDDLFIHRGLSGLTERGQLIGVFAANILYKGGSSLYFRKEAIDNNILNTVILLPENLFSNTAISTAILLFSKKKELPGQVKMVDASNFSIKEGRKNILDLEKLLKAIKNGDKKVVRLVSNQEIFKNDFSFNPALYLSDKLDVPDGFELKKFKELVTAYRGSRAQNGLYRLVKGNTLAEDRFQFDKSFTDLPVEEANSQYSVLDKDLLLLLRIGRLKPTYFHYTKGINVCCNQNVSAFEFNEGAIYPEYLINELSKEYVAKQVLTRSNGVAMQSITLRELLEIEVLVPSIELQRSIFENDKQTYSLSKAKELGLESVIAQMKSEYIAIVEDRQHDMRKYLRSLIYSNKQLAHLLNAQKGFTNEINEVISSQANTIADLSDMIKAFACEEQFGEAEKVNLDEFLANLEINHNSDSFDIVYDLDNAAYMEYCSSAYNLKSYSLNGSLPDLNSEEVHPCDIYTSIAPIDLKRLVDNIIGNAQMHSFTDGKRSDYEVRIDLSIDKERNMFQIDFRNNGMPFPLGLTKEFYGRRGKGAGKTKNTGNGGYIVKSICEHFGGDYDIYCDPLSNMPVTVRIYFPIFRDDE